MSTFLQKRLEEHKIDFSKITDEILLVENFISDQDLEEVFKIINSTQEEDWCIEYHSNLKNFCMEKFGRDDVDNLVAEGKFEITENWRDKNLNILDSEIYKKIYRKLNRMVEKEDYSLILSGFATIQRMQKDVELKSHTDQHTDPSIRYAAILYLNNDYVGGELVFENLDITVKPKAKSLLIFPGDDKHKHGVNMVGDGPIRYVLVGFVKVKNFYENNKY